MAAKKYLDAAGVAQLWQAVKDYLNNNIQREDFDAMKIILTTTYTDDHYSYSIDKTWNEVNNAIDQGEFVYIIDTNSYFGKAYYYLGKIYDPNFDDEIYLKFGSIPVISKENGHISSNYITINNDNTIYIKEETISYNPERIELNAEAHQNLETSSWDLSLSDNFGHLDFTGLYENILNAYTIEHQPITMWLRLYDYTDNKLFDESLCYDIPLSYIEDPRLDKDEWESRFVFSTQHLNADKTKLITIFITIAGVPTGEYNENTGDEIYETVVEGTVYESPIASYTNQ